MDRTRKHGGPPKSQRSWIDTIGRTLYFLGIFGQVCWNVVGLYRGIRPRILDICDTDEIVFEEQPSGVQHVSATLVSLTCWVTNLNPPFAESLRNSIFILMSNSRLIPRLVGWSFWLSVVSVWWNPKMKQSISGFDSHLKGLSDWYKYNVILLVARIIFCSLMGSVINKLDASATLGAHTFMLGFTIFVSLLAIESINITNSQQVMIVAPKSIKSDTSRLFVPLTPEKLRPYVGRSKATVHKAGDITPNPLARNALSPAGNGVKASGVCQDSRAGVLGGSPRSRKRGCPSPSSITNLMPASFQIDDAEGEEMDWDPAPPQHLNFEPTQAPRSSQLFIQPTASVPTEPSPFRGKLPPAPISMAHKLRNPPNQPRLLPPTQEAKENFFDRMSGRQIVATDDDDEAISTSGRQSDVKFAPPRFFHDDGDDPTGLTEAFESAFRLGPDEDSVRKKNHLFEIKNIDQTHLSRALVLLLVFFVWEYALAYPSENRAILPPISMVVCGFVALLSIYNYTVSPWAKKQSKSIVVLGGIFATMQTFAAGYIIYDMRARTAHSEIPHLQGALLIGTMLIQEACFIGFIKG